MNCPKHTPKTIEFIQQRRKTDCGIACLAMLTKHLYEEVVTIFPILNKTKNGLYPEEIFDALEDLGYSYCEINNLPTRGVALLSIQWKEPNTSGHYVVYDSKRKQFLDPLHGIINKKELLKYSEIEFIWKITKG